MPTPSDSIISLTVAIPEVDMATLTKSTTSPDNSIIEAQGMATSDMSTSNQSPSDIDSKGELSTIIPLEIEGTNVDDAEYPTGIKFWLILMAAFLSLILVGLVCCPRISASQAYYTESLIFCRISVSCQQLSQQSLRISRPLRIWGGITVHSKFRGNTFSSYAIPATYAFSTSMTSLICLVVSPHAPSNSCSENSTAYSR